MNKSFWILIIITVLFYSCQQDTPDIQPAVHLQDGVFIINQGNFTAGNASLSYYERNDNKLYNDLFYAVNQVPLGDVAQSITISNGTAYIVVNNSGLVYAIDVRTAEFKAKISGLSSPRFLLKTNGSKAYISDLYRTSIAIVDLNSNTVTGEIEVGRSTEEMVMIGDEVFAANWSGYNQSLRNDKILVIKTYQDQLVDSISVGLEPNSMVVDKHGYLWVLCSGGYLNEENPTLWRIDAHNRHIISKLTFDDINTSPDNLEINGTGDSLYFLNHGVFRMSVGDAALPGHPFIEEENDKYFLCLGVDPVKGDIYVSDAIDYLRNGYVYHYSVSGILRNQLLVGIIPGPFGFNY